MDSPQVNTPAMQELFAKVQQLSMSDLEIFVEYVTSLYAQLSRKEDDLLIKINEGIPESDHKQFLNLRQRRDTLQEDERKEYLRLISLIETKDAERIWYIAELAELRGVSIDVVMSDLEIFRVNHV